MLYSLKPNSSGAGMNVVITDVLCQYTDARAVQSHVLLASISAKNNTSDILR